MNRGFVRASAIRSQITRFFSSHFFFFAIALLELRRDEAQRKYDVTQVT